MVFDEYQEEVYTKYGAHERRTGGSAGPIVDFTRDMVMKSTSYPQVHQAAIHWDARSKLGTRWMRNTS